MIGIVRNVASRRLFSGRKCLFSGAGGDGESSRKNDSGGIGIVRNVAARRLFSGRKYLFSGGGGDGESSRKNDSGGIGIVRNVAARRLFSGRKCLFSGGGGDGESSRNNDSGGIGIVGNVAARRLFSGRKCLFSGGGGDGGQLIKMEDDKSFLQFTKYSCLLFDIDDTLYPLSSGLAAAFGKNISDYMVEHLGIDQSKIVELGNLLYKNYGTTMAGLRAIGYDFDIDEYHSFLHGRLPYENLKSDPVLRSLLLSLPIRKVIFTNADKVHALKVLKKLGLEDCFEGTICFETLNPIHKSSVSDDEDDREFVGSAATANGSNTPTANSCAPEIFDIIGHFAQPNPSSVLPKTPILCKPSEASIKRALEIANTDPSRTLFFEDSVRNVQSGKRVGLDTVLVGTSQRVKGADYALESIHNLREAIPELWESDIKSDISYKKKVAVTGPMDHLTVSG